MARKAFRQSSLFSDCPPEKISCTSLHFTKGSRVPGSLMGEAAVGMVVQGCVQVYSSGTADARVNLSTLRPGDCFGISTIFIAEELTTLLVCDRQTTVAYLTRQTFMSLLQEYPQMFVRYACICNQKITYLTRKIELLTAPSCRARLAGYLWEHKDSTGQVLLERSKEQLAHMLGVSRASLFRELQFLTSAGILAVENRKICILQPKALQAILEEARADRCF